MPFPAPNRLHLWWARRPLVASRAAILAILLLADADGERFMPVLGSDLAKAVLPSASDFEILEKLRRLAYADRVDRPTQLALWNEDDASTS